jgi:competence protein ComGC
MALTQQNIRMARRSAFTVVELLVAVSIMTLIVLALYNMFDQTQRALRGNVAQVDTLEGGRSAMELMSRELEQMRAGKVVSNVNLYAGMIPPTPIHRQQLVQTNVFRTNVLQELFFLSHSNKSWSATGYRILTSTNQFGIFDTFALNGVGTLARFSTNTFEGGLIQSALFGKVMDPSKVTLANYQRVVDGVVHFRVTAYDTSGVPMSFTNRNNYIGFGVDLQNDPLDLNAGQTRYIFTNKAAPAYLELELGLLEPQVLERYKSMLVNPALAADYLAKQARAVHLFQQRIPVRTAQ